MTLHDESYFQQVNRRLAAAGFLLSAYDNFSSTAIEKQACLDSALLQIYCAVFNYCNELLENYRKPALYDNNFNLHQIFSEDLKTFENVYEFAEIKDWATTEGSYLHALCQLPSALLSISQNKPEAETAVKQQNIITVVSDKQEISLDTPKKVTNLLEQLQSLIDRQRACQVEY